MKVLLSIAALALAFMFAGCSDSTPVNVDIGEIGDVEDVLAVKALTGDGKVNLTWERPADTIGVSIRRSETDFPFSVTSGEEIYAGADSSYIDEDVFIGQRYYYLIVAIDKNLNFAGGVKKSSYAYDYGNISHVSNRSLVFSDIAIDTDYIYSAGYYLNENNNYELVIEKHSKTIGELVTTFGSNGIISNNPSNGDDKFNCVKLDGDYIYIAGHDTVQMNTQWRIEKRRIDTGALDTVFGSGGVVQSNPSSNLDETISDCIIDNTYIYSAGSDLSLSSSDAQWRIEKRRKDTGALDTVFGSGGVIQSNPASNSDLISSIAGDDTYIYIAGTEYTVSTPERLWRIEKRRKDTGVLETAFGSGGILQIDPSTRSDTVANIVIDDTYIYIAGEDYTPGDGNSQWRIEKRRKDTGALDLDFGSGGIILRNITASMDVIKSIEIDNNSLYVAGVSSNTPFFGKYLKTDGSAVASFGTNGSKNFTPCTDWSHISRIQIFNNYLYAAGYGGTGDLYPAFILIIDPSTGLLRTGSLVEME